MSDKRLPLWLLLATAATGQVAEPTVIGHYEHQGIVIDLTLSRPPGAELSSGQPAGFELNISDHATGSPLSGVYPAVWLTAQAPNQAPRPAADAQQCRDRVQTLVGGSLFSEVALDLNVFHVLTLNDDASVAVVDPRFGFANPRLLRRIALPGNGYDWALSHDQQRLFVTVPEQDTLILIDTTGWRTQHTELPGHPRRVALQPDQRYLWVTLDSGVAVFDSQPDHDRLRRAATIDTGSQALAIAFSPDSRHAYLANREAGTVSIIDIATLSLVDTLATGPQPVSMDWSTLADALYVSHAGDGSIVAIDGQTHQIRARTWSEPGLGMLRFTPNQRWALMVNPRTDRLSILDAASHRIVQSGLVERRPDQIAFSNDLAYIRHRDSSTLLMLTLDDPDIGRPGVPIPVVDTPGGDQPPGRMALPTPAAGIVKVPGASAVVLSNPGDQAVYFYKEGMAAPMGQFLSPDSAPRAVLALDRSFKERRKPGLYQTWVTLPAPGDYDVVLFVDAPRVVHCFTLTVPGPRTQPTTAGLRFVVVAPTAALRAGKPARLHFKLVADGPLPTPVGAGLPVTALVASDSGLWSQQQALSTARDGSIELKFKPPLAGDYRVYLQSDALGLSLTRTRPTLIHVAVGRRNAVAQQTRLNRQGAKEKENRGPR